MAVDIGLIDGGENPEELQPNLSYSYSMDLIAGKQYKVLSEKFFTGMKLAQSFKASFSIQVNSISCKPQIYRQRSGYIMERFDFQFLQNVYAQGLTVDEIVGNNLYYGTEIEKEPLMMGDYFLYLPPYELIESGKPQHLRNEQDLSTSEGNQEADNIYDKLLKKDGHEYNPEQRCQYRLGYNDAYSKELSRPIRVNIGFEKPKLNQ